MPVIAGQRSKHLRRYPSPQAAMEKWGDGGKWVGNGGEEGGGRRGVQPPTNPEALLPPTLTANAVLDMGCQA